MTKQRPRPVCVVDSKTFVRELDPAVRNALTYRRDLPGFLRISVHFGLILVLSYLIGQGIVGWPLLLLPLGILQVFLFTLLHEVSHETVFRAPWLNKAVAWITGVVLILGPRWFRYFHFAHHKHTHDPELDPELAQPKPQTVVQYVWHITGQPLWKNILTVLWTNATGKADHAYVPARQKPKVVRDARLMIAVYLAVGFLSLMLASPLLLWIWVVPMLLGQPFLRVYLMAEHTLCPHSDDMFENTRTTFTMRAIRLIAWNMPYHAEHHACPTVPFHQLPALHELTKDHLRSTAQGYAQFHSNYRATL